MFTGKIITSSYVLVGQEITGCEHISLLLLYDCESLMSYAVLGRIHLTFPFQTHLQIPKGSRHSCVFICIPSMYFPPYQTPLLHSPFEA